MNRCDFIGRIASDLELRNTQSGIPTISFKLAVPRKYKDASGERPTDFISCVAWKHHAEFIHKFIHKGDKVGITGSLQTRSYKGQDGLMRYVSEINVEEIEGCASAQGKQEAAEPQGQSAGFTPIEDPDELPF